MKMEACMKQKLVFISGFIFLISFCILGVFGIPVALILSGATGAVVGLCKKERSLLKLSVIALFTGIFCIVAFFILLSHSNM